MISRPSGLVVARPPRLRDSLLVLLRASPRLGRVEGAPDVRAALGAACPPAVVVVAASALPGGVAAALRRLRAAWPAARYAVLAAGEEGREGAAQAGADAALEEGTLPGRLLEAVEALLAAGPGEGPGPAHVSNGEGAD
jgi:DNA-binding NarL/FixJ family response regulator